MMYGLHRQPDYPAAISQVGSLSSEELTSYIEEGGDQKLEEFVKSLNQVKELYREKEILLASNRSLAEYNFSQKPLLESQNEALQTKKEEAISLAKKVKNLRSDLDAQSKKVQPDVLLSLLEASYAEAEEFSEKLADSFLEGKEENLDEFLDKFQEARKLSHCRRVKVDKLKEIIANSGKTGSARSPYKAPSADKGGSISSGLLPYPSSSSYPQIPTPLGMSSSQNPSISLPYPPQPSQIYPFIPAYPPIP